MKSLLTALAVCGFATIVGCSSTGSQAVNPGAVDAVEASSCSSSCSAEKEASSCPYSGSDVAPAAVEGSSCSSSKPSSCSSSCSSSKETDG